MLSNDMVLDIQNLSDSTKTLLELINKISKVAGYIINLQKPVVLLYSNNRLLEREIKKTIWFAIASQRIKYFGKYLIKDVKYLYPGICKSLMKETEEGVDKWKDVLCL